MPPSGGGSAALPDDGVDAPPPSGETGSRSLADPCGIAHDSEVIVASAGALATALAGAQPGRMIRLQPGSYKGNFQLRVSGTEDRPIVLCGPRTAVLDGGSTGSGYTVHFDRANRWILSGFTVTRGKKAIMLDQSNHNLLTGLLVYHVGEEAVHFRRFSSDNTLSWSEIRDTGLHTPGYGEAVYVGSAHSNWKTYTGSSKKPDRSDGNRVLDNVLGPNVAAEHVDIKEGTAGGEVGRNVFHGAGMSGANYADSWMDVKGSGYLIAGNVGTDARTDGFQTHVAVSGWGNNNVFSGNQAAVNGPGYGFNVDKASKGNVVYCDNSVQAAGRGFANVACAR